MSILDRLALRIYTPCKMNVEVGTASYGILGKIPRVFTKSGLTCRVFNDAFWRIHLINGRVWFDVKDRVQEYESL
jgi:hypothetical protein